MITLYKLTPRSSNRKTGPIATTMSSRNSCAPSCPYANGGGCYAESFPLKLHWDRLSRGETGDSWLDLTHRLRDAKLKPGTLLRHNVAGDLPHEKGRIKQEILRHLSATFVGAGTVPFTYTHHRQDADNLATIKEAICYGFTINLSCDSERQASQRYRDGFPAVCVVPDDDTRTEWTDADGVAFRVCPAQLEDGVTCETCRVCSMAHRSHVVAFRAHGNRKRKVSDRLREAVDG